MSEPVVFRVIRPYRSVDDFLEAEARFLDRKTMLIVDAEELPADTVVRFGVDLESGEAVIRAEGTVVEYVRPTEAAPGGLRVRFKRYGGSTKSVLDRAKEVRARVSIRSVPKVTETSEAGGSMPPAPDSAPDLHSVPLQPAPQDDLPRSDAHQPARRTVARPDNRDELLASLRERARTRPSQVSAASRKT